MARVRKTSRLKPKSGYLTVGEFILKLVTYLLIKNGNNNDVNAVYILTGSDQEILNQKVLKVNPGSSSEIFIFNVNWVWNFAVRDKYGLYIFNFTHLQMVNYLYLLTYGSNILSRIKSTTKQGVRFVKIFQVHNISEASNLNIALLDIDFFKFLHWLVSDKYKILFELEYDSLSLRIKETSLVSIINDPTTDDDPERKEEIINAAINIECALNPKNCINRNPDLKIGFADKKILTKGSILGSIFEITPSILLKKMTTPASETSSKIMDLIISNLNYTLINDCEKFCQNNLLPDSSIKSFYNMIGQCVIQIVDMYSKKQPEKKELSTYLKRIKRFFMKVPFHGPDVDSIFCNIEKNGLSIFLNLVESHTYVTHSKIPEPEDENIQNYTVQFPHHNYTSDIRIKRETNESVTSPIAETGPSIMISFADGNMETTVNNRMESFCDKKANIQNPNKTKSTTKDLEKANYISKHKYSLGSIVHGTKSLNKNQIINRIDDDGIEKRLESKELNSMQNKGSLNYEKDTNRGSACKYKYKDIIFIENNRESIKFPKPTSMGNQYKNLTELQQKAPLNNNHDDRYGTNMKRTYSKREVSGETAFERTRSNKSKSALEEPGQSDYTKAKANYATLGEDESNQNVILDLEAGQILNNNKPSRSVSDNPERCHLRISIPKKSTEIGEIFNKYSYNINYLINDFRSQFTEICQYGKVSAEAQLSSFIQETALGFSKELKSTFDSDFYFSAENKNSYGYEKEVQRISDDIQQNLKELTFIISKSQSDIKKSCEDYEKKLARLIEQSDKLSNQINSLKS